MVWFGCSPSHESLLQGSTPQGNTYTFSRSTSVFVPLTTSATSFVGRGSSPRAKRRIFGLITRICTLTRKGSRQSGERSDRYVSRESRVFPEHKYFFEHPSLTVTVTVTVTDTTNRPKKDTQITPIDIHIGVPVYDCAQYILQKVWKALPNDNKSSKVAIITFKKNV